MSEIKLYLCTGTSESSTIKKETEEREFSLKTVVAPVEQSVVESNTSARAPAEAVELVQ